MRAIKPLAVFIAILIVSLPICFAEQINLQYDSNGNLVTGDGKYRAYNSLNQLTKVYNGSDSSGLLLEEFTHHPTEERVLIKKVYNNDSSWKETVYYIDEDFVRVKNSSGTFDHTYVKHNGQLIGQLNPDSSKYFIHPDHLGSSTVVTNESGDVIENTSHSPYGLVLSGGEASMYGYESKEHDSVVGDTDFHFRKYKPEWALFSQADTLIQNAYDPQNLNRYMFERGNPFGSLDPTGHNQVVDVVVFTGITMTLTVLFLIEMGVLSVAGGTLHIVDNIVEEDDTNTDNPDLYGSTYNAQYEPNADFNSFREYQKEVDAKEEYTISTGPPSSQGRKDKVPKSESKEWKRIKANTRPRTDARYLRTDGKYSYRWDKLHGDIEMYRNVGAHKIKPIGSLDPQTGVLYRLESAKPIINLK